MDRTGGRLGTQAASVATFATGAVVAALASLSSSGLSEAAGDVGFVMGVMGASLYWSTLIVTLRGETGSPRLAMLLRAQVTYTLRTCVVAALGVACVAAGAILGSFPELAHAATVANAAAFGLLAIMLLRILTIVGAFTAIVDARLDTVVAPAPEAEAPGRSRWKRPPEHAGRG